MGTSTSTVGTPKSSTFGPPVVIPDLSYGEVDGRCTRPPISRARSTRWAPARDRLPCRVRNHRPTAKRRPAAPATPYAGPTDVTADLSGLSVEGDYHYRIVVSNANGTNPGPDRTFHTHAVLDTQTDPATEVERTTATLNGSLDPDGIATTYHFEYGIDTNYRQKTDEHDAGSGSGQIAVAPAQIDSLQPGRTYHYRIVAKNELGTTHGNDRTFTAAASPAISGVYPSDVGETSAIVHATINTFEADTTYRFEYGPTEEYGSSAPVPDGQIAGSGEPQDVQAQLTGLVSGASYFFRVVATNKWGTTVGQNATFSFFPPNCPNAHIRQVTESNYLPDCRAYELVSPGDAGAVTLFPGEVPSGKYPTALTILKSPLFKAPPPNARGLASNPPRFGYFGSIGTLNETLNGGKAPNTLLDRYVATRTTTGWVSTYPGLKGNEVVLEARPRCDLTMSVCIDYDAGDPFGSGAFSDFTPHVWSVSGEELGRWPTNRKVVPNIDKLVDSETGELTGDERPSPDFSHYVLTSREVLFDPTGVSGAPGSAYDNDLTDRTIQVVSTLPNGDPIAQDAGDKKEFIRLPAVSDDGSHILMSTVGPGETTHLYMRVNDSVTYDVSQGFGVTFVGMSTDGSKVVFTSKYNLTSDDTDTSVDMFEWDEETNSLTRVSQGNENGNSDDCNAGWISGCGVAPIVGERPELDNVIAPGTGDPYFYSPEQLDPENPGVLNERNLYVFRNGKAQYVATLGGDAQVYRSQISPDGDHAAFLTDGQLTRYDNEGWREMYTYDADTGTVRCASCIPSGEPPTVMRPEVPGSGNSLNVIADVEASQSGPFMTDDGRVAFATGDALVPEDTNGLMDVYEFVDSRPRLISSGTGQRDTYPGTLIHPPARTGLESVSADGIDIYFATYDTLVPQDHNGPSSSSTTPAPTAASRSRRPCSPASRRTSATGPRPKRRPARRTARARTWAASGNLHPEKKTKKTLRSGGDRAKREEEDAAPASGSALRQARARARRVASRSMPSTHREAGSARTRRRTGGVAHG